MEPKYRITDSVKWQMLVLAGIFDLISLVPLLNTITKVFALGIFYMWFKIEGVSYSNNPKILANTLLTAIIGLIPIASIVPEQIWNVWKTIAISREEDKATQSNTSSVINQVGKRFTR